MNENEEQLIKIIEEIKNVLDESTTPAVFKYILDILGPHELKFQVELLREILVFINEEKSIEMCDIDNIENDLIAPEIEIIKKRLETKVKRPIYKYILLNLDDFDLKLQFKLLELLCMHNGEIDTEVVDNIIISEKTERHTLTKSLA